MPMPAKFLGVTARQLMILVIVGCAGAYLFNSFDEKNPETQALEAFIRSEEQVHEQVGAVLEVTLVRHVVAYPGYGPAGDSPGYKRWMYAVEGERGQLIVTLKQVDGEQGIEVTEIRRP